MLSWSKRGTIHTPTVKWAGWFWGTVLRRMGFHAVYAPNGHIYVSRDAMNSRLDRPDEWLSGMNGGKRCWLIEHEKAHHYQRCRDGWWRFWLGISWAYMTVGHAASPYEIEANDIADMAVGW